jgi:adenylate cyclase
VKNIPTPVHAYMVAMRREDGTYATPQTKKKLQSAASPNWAWPLAATVVSLVAIGVGGFLYFTKLEMPAAQEQTPPAGKVVAVTPSQPANAAPSPGPSQPQSASPPPSVPAGEKLVPGTVPFIGERTRLSLANEYLQGAGYKAFALCAEHDRQLGGESLLSSLMTAKD